MKGKERNKNKKFKKMVVKIEFSCSTLWEIIFAKRFTKLFSRALPIEEVKSFGPNSSFLPNKKWRNKYVGYKFLKIAK